MDNKELLKSLADTHNLIMQIAVRGEDAIRVARALTNLRGLTQALSSESGEQ